MQVPKQEYRAVRKQKEISLDIADYSSSALQLKKYTNEPNVKIHS